MDAPGPHADDRGLHPERGPQRALGTEQGHRQEGHAQAHQPPRRMPTPEQRHRQAENGADRGQIAADPAHVAVVRLGRPHPVPEVGAEQRRARNRRESDQDGQTREAVLDLFEHARQQLRQANREAEEDAVMDVMDFLVGWCSPQMRLPATAV